MTVAGRIVEPDFGEQLKLKANAGGSGPAMLSKAKSVIDENASETILSQAFDVIFKEIERYITMLNSFGGATWSTYVANRNKKRKDGEDISLSNEDDILLDEAEKEKDEEKDDEDKKSEGDKSEGSDKKDKSEEEKKESTEETPEKKDSDDKTSEKKEDDDAEKKSEGSSKSKKEGDDEEKDEENDDEKKEEDDEDTK